MFYRAKRCSGNTQTETLAERVGDQRNLAQVRKETALRAVVGVADVVARLDALAGQFAYTGHGYTFISSVLPSNTQRHNPSRIPTGNDWKVAVL
jgi:hypothetical protein